jgi:hypothetical protein
MIPWIIFAVVVVPLAIIAFAAVRRTKAAGEHPSGEDAATRARTEREFAEAEAYEAEWREENRDHHRDRIP